jgi:malate synthase
MIILGNTVPEFQEILTPEALAFVEQLEREFGQRRRELLKARVERQKELNAGAWPQFRPETADVRAADWKVAHIPPDLQSRHVEITGPTERKMMINALNSGASVFMADFEDANSPTWENMIQGHLNLRDAIERTISLTTPEKTYKLNDKPATLFVRPRGWHLTEKHALVDDKPSPPLSSTLACICFTMPLASLTKAPGRTSICLNWRVISKRGCGMTSSTSHRIRSAFRAAPSK